MAKGVGVGGNATAVGVGGKVMAVGVGGNVTAVGVGGKVTAVGVGAGATTAGSVVGSTTGVSAGSEDVHAITRKRATEITASVGFPRVELVLRMIVGEGVQKRSRIICDLTRIPFRFDAGVHDVGCRQAYNPPVAPKNSK